MAHNHQVAGSTPAPASNPFRAVPPVPGRVGGEDPRRVAVTTAGAYWICTGGLHLTIGPAGGQAPATAEDMDLAVAIKASDPDRVGAWWERHARCHE